MSAPTSPNSLPSCSSRLWLVDTTAEDPVAEAEDAEAEDAEAEDAEAEDAEAEDAGAEDAEAMIGKGAVRGLPKAEGETKPTVSHDAKRGRKSRSSAPSAQAFLIS